LLIFNESEPQAPSPLIRPADSDFGGAGRGENQNQRGGDECGWLFESLAFLRNTIAPYPMGQQ